VLMLVVSILHLHDPTAAQMDALKISLENSMRSRRSFSSQLPVEDLFACFFSAEIFGHVINV
jgi:hypothetical protein